MHPVSMVGCKIRVQNRNYQRVRVRHLRLKGCYQHIHISVDLHSHGANNGEFTLNIKNRHEPSVWISRTLI